MVCLVFFIILVIVNASLLRGNHGLHTTAFLKIIDLKTQNHTSWEIFHESAWKSRIVCGNSAIRGVLTISGISRSDGSAPKSAGMPKESNASATRDSRTYQSNNRLSIEQGNDDGASARVVARRIRSPDQA